MKKIVAFIFVFFVSMSNVFAQVNTLQLKQEDIIDNSLVRTYENPETKIGEIVYIDIPQELLKQVQSSDNQVLEAKKLLLVYYTEHKMNDEIKQLKNEKLVKRDEKLTLAPFMVDIFTQQNEIAQNYLQIKLDDKTNDEKPKKVEKKEEKSYTVPITIGVIIVVMAAFLTLILRRK